MLTALAIHADDRRKSGGPAPDTTAEKSDPIHSACITHGNSPIAPPERLLPVILACTPEGFDCDLERNRAGCPETTRILESMPCVRGAAFSRLDPGSFIPPHTDEYRPGVMRIHLGLRVELNRCAVGVATPAA